MTPQLVTTTTLTSSTEGSTLPTTTTTTTEGATFPTTTDPTQIGGEADALFGISPEHLWPLVFIVLIVAGAIVLICAILKCSSSFSLCRGCVWKCGQANPSPGSSPKISQNRKQLPPYGLPGQSTSTSFVHMAPLGPAQLPERPSSEGGKGTSTNVLPPQQDSNERKKDKKEKKKKKGKKEQESFV